MKDSGIMLKLTENKLSIEEVHPIDEPDIEFSSDTPLRNDAFVLTDE